MSRSRFEQLTTPHRRDGEEPVLMWSWLYLGFALVLALFLMQSLTPKQGDAKPTPSAQPSATPQPTPSPVLPSLPANLEGQLKQNFKQLKWPVAAANLKTTPQALIWRVPAIDLFAWDQRTLTPRSQALFRRLASQLKTWNVTLQIEGAGLPVRSGNLRWVSDWELSALQAARIADFLLMSQAPAERLQVLAGKPPQAGKPQSLGNLHLHFLAQPTPTATPTAPASARSARAETPSAQASGAAKAPKVPSSATVTPTSALASPGPSTSAPLRPAAPVRGGLTPSTPRSPNR